MHINQITILFYETGDRHIIRKTIKTKKLRHNNQ